MSKINPRKDKNFKISLCYLLSLEAPYEIGIEENKKNEAISNLFSDIEEINYIIKNYSIGQNLMMSIYFNKPKIHSILYELEKTIKLESSQIKNNNSNYFYLDLLIEESPNIINYEYSFDVVDNIYKYLNKEIENEKNIFNKLVTSKLLIVLINNFREFPEQYEEEEEKMEEKLKEIENKALEIFENCKKELKDLKNIEISEGKIDIIYADIINDIIKKEIIIKDYSAAIKILELMDLKNIRINKNMYDKLENELNKEEIKRKYTISEVTDLSKKETINFYYILFKYILKSKNYLYQLPLISNSRKGIIKMLKKMPNDFLNILDDINNNTKLKYILDFIVDSKFYEKKYGYKKSIKNVLNSQISQSQNSQNIVSTLPQSIIKINNEEDYRILKLEKIIRNKKKIDKNPPKYISIDFIREMSNGYFIFSGLEDMLYVYNKDLVLKNDIKFELHSFQQQQLETQANSCKIKALKFKNTQNIVETNESKSLEAFRKDKIELLDCSKYGLSLYTLNCSNSSRNSNQSQMDLTCNGCFEINGQYIVYGEKGIYHFNKNPFSIIYENDSNINNNRINSNNNNIFDIFEQYNKVKLNCKGGIRINNNLISLTSNKILPNGEDRIIFYDTQNKKIINDYKGCSCIVGINGIILLKTEKEDKNILLYACKKYVSSQENGILLINPDIKENEEVKAVFKRTDYFEVKCFCQITIKDQETKAKIKTNYFFVGGFDVEKRIGVIKLYKIIMLNDIIDIEFIDDLDFEEDKITFSGGINCIVQSRHSGKILVSCSNKKVYIFSEPNINFYLNEDKEDLLN